MQTSQHLPSSRRVAHAWYWLASTLVVLGALTLLALERGALGRLGAAPSWAWPSLATGTAVGALALGWLALTRFAREAEQRPYVWTAPLLVLFCFAPLSQLGVALPLPGVPLIAYLIGSGVLIVGGGVFGRAPGAGPRAVGATLTLTPALVVVLGHVLRSGTPRGALSQVDGPGLWLLGMLLFAGLGVFAIAVMGRALEQLDAHARNGLAAADAEHLAELVQHAEAQRHACQAELARLGEQRQLFAAWVQEQRALLAQQAHELAHAPSAPVAVPATASMPEPTVPRLGQRAAARAPGDDTQQFMALARPGLGWPAKLTLALLTLAGAAAAAYFGWYRPTLAGQQAQARAAEQAAARQAADVAALRDKLAEEQARAAQAVEEARAKAEAARLEAERVAQQAAQEQAAAAQAEAEAAQAAEAEAAKSSTRAAARRRAVKKRAAERGSARRAKPAAADSSDDDPIAGLDGL